MKLPPDYVLQWVENDVFKFCKEEEGCLIWQRSVGGNGYPGFGMRGKSYVLHRLVHLVFNMDGQPFEGQVHHTCRNKKCLQPDHLTNLTDSEHKQQHAEEKRERFCRKGHDTWVYGRRNNGWCMECGRIYDKRRYETSGPR